LRKNQELQALQLKLDFHLLILKENKLGLSWAKLSHSWALKLEFEVDV